MKTVRDLLSGKGDAVYSVAPSATVYEALGVMAERGIGAVLVLDQDRLVGIISERDYARQVILKGKTSRDTPVSDIMTTSVVYVTPDRTVDECMAIMTNRRCRHLPVVVDRRVTGVLSIGDVVKALISEKQFEIEQLTSYILKG
jgi:CBS domain-containing protein